MTQSNSKDTARSTGALFLFCTGFSIYFLYIKSDTFGVSIPKSFYCILMIWFVRFIVTEAKKGYKSYLHEKIMLVCEHAIYLNFLVILLNYLNIVTDVYIIIPAYNGLISFICLSFLFTAYRKGYFKNNIA